MSLGGFRPVAFTGKIRILMTNLFNSVRFPAAIIDDFCHLARAQNGPSYASGTGSPANIIGL